ncbi:MAG: UDP-2,3-diacylglucosamine diphosphatase [Rhizobacter sp.]|nr:UDP-2,3-diacylglucosamine diphosphatase [Rhizobacter sp.]
MHEGLAALPEVHAPAGWHCIEFISDLHLSADTPRTFDAWAAYMSATSADAVFILGDLFEVWVGDDARFEGFEARCAEVLRDAASRRHVAFMVGNRDFLVGPDLLQACGVSPLPDPVVLVAFGQRWLLTHGDALCLADTEYQHFRATVRGSAWQQAFLAQALPIRREYAAEVRRQSEARKKNQSSPADWADVDFPAARALLRSATSQTMLHGHTHRPATESLGEGCVRHVLSDWDLDHASLRAEVLRLSASGLARLPMADTLQA